MQPEQGAAVFGMIFILFFAFIGLLFLIVTIWAFCRIFSKAGYSWAMGLLMLVPFGNIIVALILAFGNWPVHRELQSLKQQYQVP